MLLRRHSRKTCVLISPVNLNGTVSLLKDLGRTEQAKELIDFYIASRDGVALICSTSPTRHLAAKLLDPDVRAAFEKKRDAVREQREPKEHSAGHRGSARARQQEDVRVLAAVSVDEYYKLFTENERDEMQRMIWTALSFEKVGYSTGQEIAKRAREALKRIGRESAINARRVRRYGVCVDE